VANEVKELARQTGEATEKITSMIEAIQDDTRHAVSAVESITNSVTEVNDLANTIASATEEQTATVAEITSNIDRATEAARGVKTNADTLLDHSREFTQLRSELDVIEKGMTSITTEGALLLSQVVVKQGILNEVQEFLPTAFKVKSIIYQHLQWRDNVINGVLQAVPPEVETDPYRCGLGRFLDTYAPDRADIRNIISKLMPVHERLHKSVIGLQELIARGSSRTDIIHYFESEIEPLFNDTLDILNQWMAMEDEGTSA